MDLLDTHDFELEISGVRWSAAVVDAATGERLWSVSPDRVLHTASVGKLFLLVEAARQIALGLLDPSELLTRTPDDSVADSGVWHTLQADTLSVVDACALIGAVSDNLATNVVLRRIGLSAVATTARELGFTASALFDRVRDERLSEHPATLSQGSAAELAELMARLHTGGIVSPAVSEQVLSWLMHNTDLSMVASPFGFDPLAHAYGDRGARLWNKTGTDSTVRADVGIVTSRRGAVAYAVVANWGSAEGLVGAHAAEGAEADDIDQRDAVLRRMRQVGGRLRDLVAET